MTDANLMDADCVHGVTWWECKECDKCTCKVTHDDATNTTTIDPTGCTYSGHLEPPCDHQLGTVIVFTRPWRRLFRKTLWRRCWFCDLKERA